MTAKRILFLFCALLVLATPLAAAAQEEVSVISLLPRNDGGTFKYPSGTGIILRWSWATISPGLVNAFLHTVEQELTITRITDPGSVTYVSADEAPAYWGPIEPWTTPSAACLKRGHGHTPLSVARWVYDLGVLEPGEYLVHTNRWVTHPIADGCVYGEHGNSTIVYSPDELVVDVTFTIVIEP